MTSGYIVTDDRRWPLSLGAENVLWVGEPVTLFRSRKAANRAVARTRQYATEKALGWGHNYTVHRVAPASSISQRRKRSAS